MVPGIGHKPLYNREKVITFNMFQDISSMYIVNYLYHGIHKYTMVYYEYDYN